MKELNELHQLCISKKISVATVESCTGGNISAAITSLPGSSSYFKGSIVAYSNEIKSNICDLPKDIIYDFSEVSYQAVEILAKNVLKKFDVDLSVATSGFSGPDGGNSFDPVGTIYIAVAIKNKVVSQRFSFKGNRKEITTYSVKSSLQMIINQLKKINN